jgi:hypothetical protein
MIWGGSFSLSRHNKLYNSQSQQMAGFSCWYLNHKYLSLGNIPFFIQIWKHVIILFQFVNLSSLPNLGIFHNSLI